MRVISKHGFIEYHPDKSSDISRFERIFGIKLLPENGYFTFEGLLGMKRYSIQGHPYANLPSIKTYEGREPGEVFRENRFVYSIASGILVPVDTITTTLSVTPTLGYVVSRNPFVQPGAFIAPGVRLISYFGILDMDNQRLLISSAESGL